MILYETERDPEAVGVYACRIPDSDTGGLLMTDIFLMWYAGKCGYLGSDQRYRGEVLGWIGPLQRRLL